MGEAKRRIDECIRDKSVHLHLDNLGLTELPNNLPDSLRYLFCYDNKLTKLPDKLPSSLIFLNCCRNELTELPRELPSLALLYCSYNKLTKLPDGLADKAPRLQSLCCNNNMLVRLPERLPSLKLTRFECQNNRLTKLPDQLPASLRLLDCSKNRLTKLPDQLPASLWTLKCRKNYIDVSNETAAKFNIIQIGYNKKIDLIKKWWKLRRRIKRLRFCKKLRDHSDEFRYRPRNGGYHEVFDRNRRYYKG